MAACALALSHVLFPTFSSPGTWGRAGCHGPGPHLVPREHLPPSREAGADRAGGNLLWQPCGAGDKGWLQGPSVQVPVPFQWEGGSPALPRGPKAAGPGGLAQLPSWLSPEERGA